MTFRRATVLGLFCLCLSGCLAVEVPDATGVTYKNSWLNVLLVLGIAGAFLVFGIGIAWETAKPLFARKPKRRKGTAKPAAELGAKQLGGLAVGGLLTVIGALMLFLGVPSVMLAYVTVGEDRVVLRDHLFWFAERPREILYSDLSNVEVEEVQELARRGTRKKEYLYLSSSAGTDRIEMAAIHKAARPKLEAAWREYRTAVAHPPAAESSVADAGPANPAVVGNTVGQPPQTGPAPPVGDQASPAPAPAAEPGLTPVAHIGRFVPGLHVSAPRDGKGERALILEVYQERKLKVLFERNPAEAIVPLDTSFIAASSILTRPGEGPGRDVTKETPLSPGMKLLAHHAGGWFPVEVHRLEGANRVVIIWEGERGRHDVPRSWLRIPDTEPVTAILPPQSQPAANPTPAIGRPLAPREPLATGEALLAEWNGKWLPVTVLEVQADGQVKVHWDGYADSFDEVLPRSKLRFPRDAR